MAATHGKGTAVLADEHDLTAYFNRYTVTRGVNVAQTTVFGNDDHTYIAGTEFGSAAVSGLWDGATDAVDEELNARVNATSVFTVGIDGVDTIGDHALLWQSQALTVNVGTPINEAVTVGLQSQADSGLRCGGRILHDLSTETATVNSASIDQSAATAFGGVGHLHVTAFTGTNVSIRIQDSTDDAVWADLIVFTSVTGVGGQRVTQTGTVNRYVRAIVFGGTFTSVTFAVAFARNRR